MSPYGVLLLLALSCSAQAQVVQLTTGHNSPAVSQGPGSTFNQFITNQVQQSRLVDELRRDKELAAVRRLVEQSNLDAAKSAIAQYQSKDHIPLARVALLKYTEAQLAAAGEDMPAASIAIAAAVGVDPSNCYYKVVQGAFLVSRHRTQELDELLTREVGRRKESCLLTGTPAERASLHLQQAWRAAEARIEADALSAMSRADSSLSAAGRRTGEREFIEPACTFFYLAKAYWETSHAQRWPEAETRCRNAMLPTQTSFSDAVSKLHEFYTTSDGQQALDLGRQLAAGFSSFDSLPLPFTDRVQRRIAYGVFLSDYGMKLLWQGNQVALAAQAYRDAFFQLEPLLPAGRPSLITNFGQLIVRISHLEQVSQQKVFPDTTVRLNAAVVAAASADIPQNGPSTCEATGTLARAASSIQMHDLAMILWKKMHECRERSISPSSHLRLLLSYRDFDSDDAVLAPIEHLEARVALGEQLSDFPLHAEVLDSRAIDQWKLTRKRFEGVDHTTKENQERYQAEMAVVARLAVNSPKSNKGRMVLAQILPLFKPNPETTAWADFLLNNDPLSTIAIHPLGRCQHQFFRLMEYRAVALFYLLGEDERAFRGAVFAMSSLSDLGNLCADLDGENDLGGSQLARSVEYILQDYKLLGLLDGGSTVGAGDLDGITKELAAACVQLLDVTGHFPMCMFRLPRRGTSQAPASIMDSYNGQDHTIR